MRNAKVFYLKRLETIRSFSQFQSGAANDGDDDDDDNTETGGR